MNNAENSISEPLGFKIFPWENAPNRSRGSRLWREQTCLVCHESLSGGFDGGGGGGGGGVAIVPY